MPLNNLKRIGGGGIAAQIKEDKVPMVTRAKRKSNELAGCGGLKEPSRKRAAFGDITNAITNKNVIINAKKPALKKVTVKSSIPVKSSVLKAKATQATKEVTKPSTSSSKAPDFVELMNQKNLVVDSPSVEIKDAVAAITLEEPKSSPKKEVKADEKVKDYVDIDEENAGDPHLCPVYAADIFQYLREQEEVNKLDDYFEKQKDISRHMRAVLVDWLVEVQENFELNHETLYLAVKLTDMYLGKCKVSKDLLQLLGATALFISCKYDERIPPALDDFLYICDDAYTRDQFIEMEQKLLKTVEFNLGVPLSYRFLRRFAKCAHATLDTLTLARFILELSLMDSVFITVADSLMAASCLMLAFRMKNNGSWDATLRHYSGYQEEELKQCMFQLNSMLNRAPNKQLATVRNKYSHPLFYEVAKIAPLDSLEL